jgi:hypothetical protein
MTCEMVNVATRWSMKVGGARCSRLFFNRAVSSPPLVALDWDEPVQESRPPVANGCRAVEAAPGCRGVHRIAIRCRVYNT